MLVVKNSGLFKKETKKKVTRFKRKFRGDKTKFSISFHRRGDRQA